MQGPDPSHVVEWSAICASLPNATCPRTQVRLEYPGLEWIGIRKAGLGQQDKLAETQAQAAERLGAHRHLRAVPRSFEDSGASASSVSTPIHTYAALGMIISSFTRVILDLCSSFLA